MSGEIGHYEHDSECRPNISYFDCNLYPQPLLGTTDWLIAPTARMRSASSASRGMPSEVPGGPTNPDPTGTLQRDVREPKNPGGPTGTWGRDPLEPKNPDPPGSWGRDPFEPTKPGDPPSWQGDRTPRWGTSTTSRDSISTLLGTSMIVSFQGDG